MGATGQHFDLVTRSKESFTPCPWASPAPVGTSQSCLMNSAVVSASASAGAIFMSCQCRALHLCSWEQNVCCGGEKHNRHWKDSSAIPFC